MVSCRKLALGLVVLYCGRKAKTEPRHERRSNSLPTRDIQSTFDSDSESHAQGKLYDLDPYASELDHLNSYSYYPSSSYTYIYTYGPAVNSVASTSEPTSSNSGSKSSNGVNTETLSISLPMGFIILMLVAWFIHYYWCSQQSSSNSQSGAAAPNSQSGAQQSSSNSQSGGDHYSAV